MITFGGRWGLWAAVAGEGWQGQAYYDGAYDGEEAAGQGAYGWRCQRTQGASLQVAG